MATIRRMVGKETDPKKLAAMAARLEEAAKRPYTYDPDCPLLTEAQLAEFRPVYFATMEEREQAMREMEGMTDGEREAFSKEILSREAFRHAAVAAREMGPIEGY